MYACTRMCMFRRHEEGNVLETEFRNPPLPPPAASWMNRCIRLTGINNEAEQFCDSRLQIMGVIIRKALREVARGYVDKPRRAGVLYSPRAITLQKYNPNSPSGRGAARREVVFVNLPAVLTLSMKNAVARSRHWFFLSSSFFAGRRPRDRSFARFIVSHTSDCDDSLNINRAIFPTLEN